MDDVNSFGSIAEATPRSIARYLEIAAQLEELLRELPTAPLYSDDLAHRIGTSARTLQVASQAVHGMSLHAYIRLTRLRSVHCQLKSGSATQSVKNAALGNGFRHMGDFSRLYKRTFGELPSETLARARTRRGPGVLFAQTCLQLGDPSEAPRSDVS